MAKVPVDKQSVDRDFQTPPVIKAAVQVYFGGAIPLDPFTVESNPMGALDWCYPGGADGFQVPWHAIGGVYVNPPFGREEIEKIGLEASLGCEILALLPQNRSETSYWQRCVAERAPVVCWIRKRVAFLRSSTGLPANSNPYASAIWGFNVDVDRFVRALSCLGACSRLTLLAPCPPDPPRRPRRPRRARRAGGPPGRMSPKVQG